ncbi:MAG TPA: AAA family ATPase [Methanothrix sp.]|nr:AAA family ATPase [Methanothrix sp.]
MKLKSVRVENYKCIDDSNEFTVEDVTCLVGKNESGKTALLQALYKLKPDILVDGKFDPLNEYPRRKYSAYKERCKTNPDNILTTCWQIETKDIDSLSDIIGCEFMENKIIKVTKGYDNEIYWDIDYIDERQIIEKYIHSAGLSEEERTCLNVSNTIEQLIKDLLANPSRSETQETLLINLQNNFSQEGFEETIISRLNDVIPKFLYFSSYQKLPGQISVDDLISRQNKKELRQNDKCFLALLDLAGTSLEELNGAGRFEELIAELESISNRLTQEIFTYWTQNKHLEVEFRLDIARNQDPAPFNKGNIFRTRIKNTRHGITVSFDERSAGFVWFFSFLVWFSQVRKNYGDNLIILLDEPGLNLHARAQADLLRYINEKLKPNHQIIYTTHSPFMIDPDNILGVRTVEDLLVNGKAEGTKVGDDVLTTDADTIFPLQAALGYDITQTLFVGKHTLLVEGPSDLLYLTWFSHTLHEMGRECLDPRWTIAPCGGIDKIGSFIALFGGNKIHVAALTDFGSGQKKKVRTLKESNLLKAGHVFSAEMYVDQDEADIEDLLGRSFYVSLVNECYNLDNSMKLPMEKPSAAPVRVLEEAERHFALLPHEEVPEFNHYIPSLFLINNTAKLVPIVPDFDRSLDRFEKLFRDLNGLLRIDEVI